MMALSKNVMPQAPVMPAFNLILSERSEEEKNPTSESEMTDTFF